jgi:hypothetical protein
MGDPMAKPVRAFALFFVPLVLLTLACSSIGGAAEEPGVLFSDDFSDVNSGWDRVQADEGVTDYENGAYRIFVDAAQHDYWANPGQSFGDVRVEVDATKIGGPDNNDFGVICRSQADDQEFYVFQIRSDGFYGIVKYAGDDFEFLGSDGYLASDAVNLGASSNHIRADCVGDTLTLYVNGTQLHSVTDSSYASGDVGLLAGTFDEAGTDIAFDDFVVREP